MSDSTHQHDLNQRLKSAVRCREVDKVRLLIQQGADVNSSDFVDQCNHLDTLELLINSKANLDHPHPHNPLLNATKYNLNTDVFEKMLLLIRSGANVNIRSFETTTLHRVLECRAFRLVKPLVDAGALVQACNSGKRTPLLMVYENNDTDMFDYFVKHGCDVDSNEEQLTLLADLFRRYSNIKNSLTNIIRRIGDISKIKKIECIYWRNIIERHHLSCIDEMIAIGADVNIILDDGLTLLTSTLKSKSERAVHAFLRHGADVTKVDRNGFRPIDCLAGITDVTILQQIVMKYSIHDINDISPGYGMKLFNSAIESKNQELVEMFIALGVDVNEVDEDNQTPLMVALGKNNPNIIKHILNAGAIWTSSLQGLLPSVLKHDDINLTKSVFRAGATIDPSCNSLIQLYTGANIDIINCLCRMGADVNGSSGHGWTALTWALSEKQWSAAFELMRYGADVNVNFPFTEKHRTPLEFSIGSNNVNLLDNLIDAGARVNPDQQSCRRSPLLMAIESTHRNIITILLDAGAEVNVVDAEGWTPLSLLLDKGEYPLAIKLIQAGASVNVVLPSTKASAFKTAMDTHQFDLAWLMIKSGLDVSTKDDDLLSISIVRNRLDMVKHFIECGVNVDQTDTEGKTPLIFAIRAENCNRDIVRVLTQAGANVNVVGPGAETALFIAIKKRLTGVVTDLLTAGADVNTATLDVHGVLSLMSVINNMPDITIVKMFVERGADVNAIHRLTRKTPLEVAITEKLHDIVQYLIECGANVNVLSSQGYLLHHAVRIGDVNCVEMLLKAGADVNQYDPVDGCPLTVALDTEKPDIARLLIAHGADLNVKCKYGRTCLMVATQLDDHPLLELVLKTALPDYKTIGRNTKGTRQVTCKRRR